MKVELHPSAEDELKNLADEIKEELKTRLQKLETNPTSNDESEPIKIRGRSVFKYVMKDGTRGGKIDHRAVYDIKGQKILVYTIFHRDKGYQKQEIARRF